jgi:hypothetical protein
MQSQKRSALDPLAFLEDIFDRCMKEEPAYADVLDGIEAAHHFLISVN